MNIVSFFVLVAAFTSSLANARAVSMPSPPECGLKCILTNAMASTCAPTDTACICTNQALAEKIAVCVKSSCSVVDQLATNKFSMDSCGVKPTDVSGPIIPVPMVLGSIAILFYGFRVLDKLVFLSNAWGWDDTFITLSIAFMIPLMALSVPVKRHGLGRDMWDNSPDDITEILYIFWWDESIYLTQISLTRISILLFYLRVFDRSATTLRPIMIGFIVINALYIVIFDFITVFQCTPVQGAWLFWMGEFDTVCRNINAQAWSAAILAIVLDLTTVILPMPELFRLSISRAKRIQLVFMFSVGLFVTVVSVIRLHSVVAFGTSENLSLDWASIGLWTTVESPVGAICACLPATRSFLLRFFPKLLGKTQTGGSSGYIQSGSAGRNGYVKSDNQSSVRTETVTWKNDDNHAPTIELQTI